MKFFLLFLLLFSHYARADCEETSDRCAAVGEWNFSVSVGAGVYTNPVNGGDNTPLLLIPGISYYGEKVFFENNTLGFTLFERDHIAISMVTQLNHENAYFTRWHPQNVFLENSTASNIDAGKGETDKDDISNENTVQKITIDDVSNKRWAIDAGIQLNWFINKKTDVEAQILHDINNVYNGFNGQFQLTRQLSFKQLPNTRVSYSLGTNVNSKQLVDYFYGVPSQSTKDRKQIYQGKLSINPYFRIALAHQISAHWHAKFNVKRIFLNKGTTNSPLIQDNHINTIFAGVTYDF